MKLTDTCLDPNAHEAYQVIFGPLTIQQQLVLTRNFANLGYSTETNGFFVYVPNVDRAQYVAELFLWAGRLLHADISYFVTQQEYLQPHEVANVALKGMQHERK